MPQAHAASTPAPSLAKVTRGTLTAQQQVNGTAQYRGSDTIVNQVKATGAYVRLPKRGQVVTNGTVVYEVGTGGHASSSALLSAKAQLASDQATLNALLSPTPPGQAKVGALQNRVQADQARLQADQEEMKSLSVRAPYTGQISKVDVTLGQGVTPGSPLFDLVNPKEVQVKADISGKNLPNIRVGESVRVLSANFGDMDATITTIGLISDSSNRGGPLYPITLTVKNPPSYLLQGAQVTVYLTGPYFTDSLPGTVEFGGKQTVTAETSGTVSKLSVSVGQTVKRGQDLITLTSPNLKAQLASDQAQLSSDQVALQQMLHPEPPRPEKVSALKARIASDKEAVTEAQQAMAQTAVPVVLLYGSTPAYRTLELGERGPDVAELNADLVKLGYAKGLKLSPKSDVFGAATAAAVMRLQSHLGIPKTGMVPFGQVVFEPAALRVTSVSPVLGASAQVGQTVLEGTSNTLEVVAQVDATLQSDVKAGDPTVITLPNNDQMKGVVTKVADVASPGSGSGGSSGNSSSPTIEVDIAPSGTPAQGFLDGVSVQASITTAKAKNVLAVPVSALLAKAGGSYDVETVTPSGAHRFIPVNVGLFDDARGLVQVSGKGLQAGQRVVVAGS